MTGVTVTATVTVAPVNDNPIPTNDSANGTDDNPITIAVATLLGNDIPGPNATVGVGGDDESGQTVSLDSVGNGTHGTAAIVNTDVVYTPNANFNGTDSFSYSVIDGNGGSVPQTVTITITRMYCRTEAL